MNQSSNINFWALFYDVMVPEIGKKITQNFLYLFVFFIIFVIIIIFVISIIKIVIMIIIATVIIISSIFLWYE